jgi:hypothetical protein
VLHVSAYIKAILKQKLKYVRENLVNRLLNEIIEILILHSSNSCSLIIKIEIYWYLYILYILVNILN